MSVLRGKGGNPNTSSQPIGASAAQVNGNVGGMTMIGLGQAKEIVMDAIQRVISEPQGLIVWEDAIIERDWGWYIPWIHEDDLRNGFPPASGITPFIVLRRTGELKRLLAADFDRSVADAIGLAQAEDLLKMIRQPHAGG